MEELLRLKGNIERLIEAGYTDEVVDNVICESTDIEELNNYIEDELSYAADDEV